MSMLVEQVGQPPTRQLADGDLLRPAAIGDARQIQALVNSYATQGLMLPKSLNQIMQYIRDFVVVERDGAVQACAALHILWSDLAEVRSLAVSEERRGGGLGRQLVYVLLDLAASLGVSQVFALTYQRPFFEHVGFRPIDRGDLPRKIWVDCVDCLKFPNCDEEGVIYDISVAGAHPRTDGLRKALLGDVEEIVEMVNYHAGRTRMLPRSRNHVYQNLRDFTVFVEDGRVIACGAMHVLWEDLGELRAVAVAPERVHQGFGSMIVRSLIDEGQRLGLPQLFAFTYERVFFERLGFRLVARDSLPRKVWGECLDCPRFPDCDELAMALDV
jgi:amino-acid N-acetyltransferase